MLKDDQTLEQNTKIRNVKSNTVYKAQQTSHIHNDISITLDFC